MCFRTETGTSTKRCWGELDRLRQELDTADAIVIGAGAGMSTSAGMSYEGQRFHLYFHDFYEKYGIQDMYSGGFYPYDTLEEYWAWWSRQIAINRYQAGVGQPYRDLLALVEGRDYFVLTTNVDHQFQLAGFAKQRLFYTQGDYGLWQCSRPCHQKTYDNEEAVARMVAQQRDMKIPSALVPKCPECAAPMTMNLRCDGTFVEDEGWHRAAGRYEHFLRSHERAHVLYLELGVGGNTPGIIKYPFWRMTHQNPKAVYGCVNLGQAYCPPQIRERSICIQGDIGAVLSALARDRE